MFALKAILWVGFVIPLLSESREDAWSGLKRLGHRQIITSLDRDGACVTGTLVSQSPDWIILALDKSHERQILRPLIVRIMVGGTSDLRWTVFSARSSWYDLQGFENGQSQRLLVITTDGKEFRGRLNSATIDELSLFEGGKEFKFAKEYVSSVYLLHERLPERSGIERSTMAPLSLPKILIHHPPVQIYDFSSSQDDTVFECSAATKH